MVRLLIAAHQILVPAFLMPAAHGREVIVFAGEFRHRRKIPKVRPIERDPHRPPIPPYQGAQEAIAQGQGLIPGSCGIGKGQAVGGVGPMRLECRSLRTNARKADRAQAQEPTRGHRPAVERASHE